MKHNNFLFEADLQWESPAQGITRQIMGYDDKLMMVKVRFEKGAIGYTHTHFHAQTTYVASGKFEIEIKGEKHILSPGEGFYVEPNAIHGAVCIEKGELIDVFSPMREDFL